MRPTHFFLGNGLMVRGTHPTRFLETFKVFFFTGGNDFEAGIQQCVANPSACGITVTTCSNNGSATSGEPASYNPSTGELHIPLIDVPGAFGGMQTYEVYLKQQPLKFTFDLDMGRVVLK